MAWNKKQEESRIHFAHNFYGLPACLQISFFQQVSAWCQHRWMHITLIFLDIFGTKKICTPLWGRKRIFVGSWVFCSSICVYLSDGYSLNFHTRIRKRFKTRLSWEHWTSLGYFRSFQAPGNCQAQAHGKSLWANSSCKVCSVKAFQICRPQIHSKFQVHNKLLVPRFHHRTDCNIMLLLLEGA